MKRRVLSGVVALALTLSFAPNCVQAIEINSGDTVSSTSSVIGSIPGIGVIGDIVDNAIKLSQFKDVYGNTVVSEKQYILAPFSGAYDSTRGLTYYASRGHSDTLCIDSKGEQQKGTPIIFHIKGSKGVSKPINSNDMLSIEMTKSTFRDFKYVGEPNWRGDTLELSANEEFIFQIDKYDVKQHIYDPTPDQLAITMNGGRNAWMITGYNSICESSFYNVNATYTIDNGTWVLVPVN